MSRNRESSARYAAPAWGSYANAEALRRWAFLRRTPVQRLDWLIEMLEIAYRTGAIRPRGPDSSIPD